MQIKSLDERLRERGKLEWGDRCKAVYQAVNSLAFGEMRNALMEVPTSEHSGKQVITIWQCIERLFQAIEAAGADRAGDKAVTEFLTRFDDVAADIDELRSTVAE